MYSLMLFFFILLFKRIKGTHLERKRKAQHSNFLQQKNALLPNILPKCWISYIRVQYVRLSSTSSFSWVYRFISCTNVICVYILYSQYNETPVRVRGAFACFICCCTSTARNSPQFPEGALVSSMCWNNQPCVYTFLLPKNQNQNIMLLKSPITLEPLSS